MHWIWWHQVHKKCFIVDDFLHFQDEEPLSYPSDQDLTTELAHDNASSIEKELNIILDSCGVRTRMTLWLDMRQWQHFNASSTLWDFSYRRTTPNVIAIETSVSPRSVIINAKCMNEIKPAT